MDLKTIHATLEQLAEEKGIPKTKIVETIELALAAAYKKDYGKKSQIIRAQFEPESGKVTFIQIKIVVDESMIKSEQEIAEEDAERIRLREDAMEEKSSRVSADEEEEEFGEEEVKKVRFNPERHIMLDEARTIKPSVHLQDELEFPLETHADYGRIAAQTAKQVIIQRIREAEREATYDEFKNRQGEIVSGVVQRVEGRNVFVDLGRAVAILPPEEQVHFERYRIGERLKALLLTVEKGTRGSGVYLSRSHPRFVAKLFEIEVPEIANGAVEIKAIAREAGSRSKIAVVSHEEGVDPVGSCVGQKGVRVSTVIAELGGEKIDIIEWDEDSTKFIANAISPARVLDVEVNAEIKEARVMVAEDQLSLAIGKGGQNVRLAAKLTGWKIDIRSRGGETVASAMDEGVVEEQAEARESSAEMEEAKEKGSTEEQKM